MLANPRPIIRRILSEHLVLRERPPVDRWAEDCIHVTTPSAFPGPFRCSLTPYVREPLRDYSDPAVREIVLRWGTQCAKTLVIMLCFAWTVDQDPAPCMWVMDSADTVREFNRDRLLPMFRGSPALHRHLPTKRWDEALQRVRFDSLTLYLTGSNSAGKLASKPIRSLFADEIDKWPLELKGKGGTEGSALSVVQARLRSYWSERKIIKSSSPSDEGVGIDHEYQQTDQAQWQVPCPSCLGYQLLHFRVDGRGGVRWQGGLGTGLGARELISFRQSVRRTAWYECERCGHAIDHAYKSWMNLRGVWVRPGQEVHVTDGAALRAWDGQHAEVGAVYGVTITPPGVVVRGERPLEVPRGYWVSSLSSPFVTWGDVAAEFVRLGGEPDREFINQWLGEAWKQPGARGDDQVIIELAQKPVEGEPPYRRGVAPASGPVVLTGAIDVQKDRVYFEVRGWGASEHSWLIDYGSAPWPESIYADPTTGEVFAGDRPLTPSEAESLMADTAAGVMALLDRSYPVSGSQCVMPVRIWAIDTGYRTQEVYALCRRVGPRVLAVKGSAQLAAPHKLGRTHDLTTAGLTGWEAERVRKQLGPSDLDLLLFSADHWKDHVLSRLLRRPPMHGAWRYPVDLTAEWPRQVTAEQRTVQNSRRGARYVWKLRPGRSDNHLLDCVVMNCAMFDALDGPRLAPEDTLASATGSSAGAAGGLKPYALG
jgi:phage terminase large subunit GpA-like protein